MERTGHASSVSRSLEAWALQLKESKVRMARKGRCTRYKVTCACTGRLVEGTGLSQKELRPEAEGKEGQLVVGGFWFEPFETARALKEEPGLCSTGNVKTAHAHIPIEQAR